MDITRRGFFTRLGALAATTALVPVAIAALSEAERRANFMILMEAAIERARARMIAELSAELWGVGSGDRRGLADLLPAEPTAARYEWKQRSSLVAVAHV